MKNGTVAFLWFASLLITWNLAKKQTVDVKAGPSSLNNYSESRLEKETVGEAEIPSGSPGSRRILVQNKTEKSPDAEALWRQLRIEVIPAGSRVSYREFFELWNHLNNLNDLELLAIIKTSHTKEYSDLSRVVNRMALSIIGENNPKAAFPLLEGLSHDAKEMSFMNLIEGWSEVDPENTLEWLESSDPLEMSAEHYTTVFMKLARKDLDLALKSFESIDVNCKVDAFKGICGQFKSSEDFHLLLENFSIHTNSQLVEVLADSWSLIDPQAAIAWGQNLDPENRKDALYTVKYRWLNNDPHSAAEWITHNSVDLKEDIAMVITHWNSLEAVDWLKSLPIENELDRDHGFINYIHNSSYNPQELVPVINDISDRDLRKNAAIKVYSYFLEYVGLDKGKEFLVSRNDFTEDEKIAIIQKITSSIDDPFSDPAEDPFAAVTDEAFVSEGAVGTAGNRTVKVSVAAPDVVE